jgi:hypothetical protein
MSDYVYPLRNPTTGRDWTHAEMAAECLRRHRQWKAVTVDTVQQAFELSETTAGVVYSMFIDASMTEDDRKAKQILAAFEPLAGMGEKHTPGPWELDLDSSGDWYISPIEAVLPGYPDDGIGCDAEEAEANARLATAAPDLLAACKAVLSKLDYLQQLWGQEGVTRGVTDKLRAAIARATK